VTRAGTPQSAAMEVTWHKTDSLFGPYNITSGDDKREAARRLREYRSTLPTKTNVVSMLPRRSTMAERVAHHALPRRPRRDALAEGRDAEAEPHGASLSQSGARRTGAGLGGSPICSSPAPRATLPRCAPDSL
jgi:hypothetical protein